ncbi:hypothetical protein G7Y79_00011g030980 [Physcia stellaris]|nr:hypothetical protein G7Y79_00011g030980 [Physcia stellaris]
MTPSLTPRPPNRLYITSLPPRSRTLPKPSLRLSLYTLFSTHGPVLDVIALRTTAMRSQAHIVFRDIRDATAALRAENGREFFGQELRVEYAKGRSHVLGRLEGTFAGAEAKGKGGSEVTSLQQAIFGRPPGAGVGGLPPIPPAPAPTGGLGAKVDGDREGEGRGASEGPQGVKRLREESGDEDEEGAPMEEESDDDVEMEEESGDSD